ncbi:NCS2 family permease [Nocardia seriolae]|uniref:MFS transporter n=1 Tax=Nocardia seriolae TaxID=37332 RepID=A0A0B8NE88_9NOCA|nr:NCS2 family permease [Nocardia seriolae]APA98329.1 Putative permease [Nocardia seriolae]MTJ63003.1 NCS2 family permease [Nocardia seriolae]MTJ75636.1 NCS2 family permease [Nocardia seriolae]MTJ88029.1 NCS2 family permease [Nocardia seriolae]MTK32018.1 NCS2 family permease [Nocardia seriolae]
MTQTQSPITTAETRGSALEKFFRLSERKTTISREIRGGITTFVAMAYVILLVPLILGGVADAHGDKLSIAQLTTATAFSAGLTTVLMGLVGNVPLALAAGLGLVPVVAYQAAPHMTWPQALGLVVLMGVVIVILAATGLRTMIINAIPMAMKNAIGVGIGMFIAMIGLVASGVVGHGAAGGPPVTLGVDGHLEGWPTVIFAVGLLLMLALFIRKVPGAILISIAISTVLAIIVNAMAKIDPKAWGTVVPEKPKSLFASPDFGLVGHIDLFGGFATAGAMTATVVLFTLVLTGFFDAMGTVFGVCDEAGLVDDKGQVPGMGKILTTDGVAQIIGGVTGGAGSTVYVESATGVGEGARTGLASVITGGLFCAAVFFTPIAAVVPIQAADPALVLVGALMMTQARKIDWNDLEVAVPAFITIVLMPFTYSITNGVGAGLIAYTVIKLARGKFREIHWLVAMVSVVFVAYFGINGIEMALGN